MAPTMAATTQFTTTTEPSGLTEFVLLQGHGVKGLSDMGLKTLPKQYVQPLDERPSSFIKVMPRHHLLQQSTIIPIIDMANWQEEEVADAICGAAEKWGFFQVVNHGVPLQVLQNVQAATYRFFELPANEKIKYSKENSSSNNVRYGSSFSPDTEKALEWKDYLSLFFVSEDEAASTWPLACRNETLEYIKKTETVIRRLLKVLMKRLNVKGIDETKESLLMGSKRINLNYYPICPNPDLTVAIGRHSDVSTLTVLLQDETGGLYVQANDGDNKCWIHVPPVSGSLVINIGDALQIMSNGRYKSVEHRVIANGSKIRVSVPIFVNPKPSDVIGPLPEVVASGEKALYKDVLYSDYVKHFFRKAHDGKDTIEFAKV